MLAANGENTEQIQYVRKRMCVGHKIHIRRKVPHITATSQSIQMVRQPTIGVEKVITSHAGLARNASRDNDDLWKGQ